MIKLIRELRQRRVFRGAGYYLLAAWGVLQVADVIAEPAGLPAWSMTVLLYLLVLGFPVAMVLSWRFDIGEHGLVRTQAENLEGVPPEPLRTVDYLIIAALIAVSSAALYGLLPVAQQAADERGDDAAPMPALRANAVAVLPFVDISQGQDQGFLGEGISDTVMHVLAQIGELSVTARTSSFAFKGKNLSVREIATALAVAHVLEGSIQRAGDKVRIIARLIDARDEIEVWSGYYDRTVESIFAIQDEIAREVAAALTTKVLGKGGSEAVDEGYRPRLDAYEKFILGKQQFALGTVPGWKAARTLFQEAVNLDPGYALAWVHLAQATLSVPAEKESRSTVIGKAMALVEKAIDLDPRLAEAQLQSARILMVQKRAVEAGAAVQRALALRPSYADAFALQSELAFGSTDFDEALVRIRRAIELDPQENAYRSQLAEILWAQGRSEEAFATIKTAIQRNPELGSNYLKLGRWSEQFGEIGKGAYWNLQAIRLYQDPKTEQWAHCFNLVQLWAFDRAKSCVDEFLSLYPDHVEARQYRAILSWDVEAAIANLQPEVGANPNFHYRRYQLADWLAAEARWEDVIDVLKPTAPEFFSSDPVVNDFNVWSALNIARALFGLGDDAQATAILEAGLDYLDRRRKLQGTGFTLGIDDVQFLIVLGRYDEAMERLTKAVQAGWRFYSFLVPFSPLFDPVRERADFQAAMQTIEDDMAGHLAWYLEHRDDPMESVTL